MLVVTDQLFAHAVLLGEVSATFTGTQSGKDNQHLLCRELLVTTLLSHAVSYIARRIA